MPQTQKPVLIAVEFVRTQPGEYEVNVSWTGTPQSPHPSQTYAGLLSTRDEVGLRDDDGTPLVRWTLRAIPVTAEFMVPQSVSSDTGIAQAKRTATLMLKAAYLAVGYKTMFPLEAK
jgi:hypothetical protein